MEKIIELEEGRQSCMAAIPGSKRLKEKLGLLGAWKVLNGESICIYGEDMYPDFLKRLLENVNQLEKKSETYDCFFSLDGTWKEGYVYYGSKNVHIGEIRIYKYPTVRIKQVFSADGLSEIYWQRFIDTHYNNLFYAMEGDYLIIKNNNEVREEQICNTRVHMEKDEYHVCLKSERGIFNTYHICELAEILNRGRSNIYPKEML